MLPLSDTKYQAPSQRQSCAWFDFETVRRLELTQPALAQRSWRSSWTASTHDWRPRKLRCWSLTASGLGCCPSPPMQR